jgi:hypothetical protein
MKIHSKLGVWYVTEPGHDVRKFDSEKDAKAYVKGEKPVKPKKSDNMWADLV